MKAFPGVERISNLINAAGDLIIGHAAGYLMRLAVGLGGQYLEPDSSVVGGLKWVTGAFGRIGGTAVELDINTTAAETSLASISVVGGTLSNRYGVQFIIKGDYLNNTGSNQTLTIRVKYGSTTSINDLTIALATSANRRAFRLVVEITGQNSASAQFIELLPRFSGTAGATTGTGDLGSSGTMIGLINGEATEDSSVDKTLDVTIQHSASSANLSIRRKNAYARKM